MPRYSTSDNVKKRVLRLLERLLIYANQETTDYEYFAEKVVVRWQDEDGENPRLLVKTKLKYLVELVFSCKDSKKQKEYLRHDLGLLENFLGILEDHRIKKQGSDEWLFTLKLWHRSVEINLAKCEAQWRKLKSSGSPKANSSHPEDSERLPKQLPPQTPRLYYNLPARHHTAFIGFKRDLTKLLKLLSSHHSSNIITIEGIGGIGKTTLVLEAACRCLEAISAPEAYPGVPNFGAIIFNSAQIQRFRGPYLSSRLRPERNLQDIFRTIFRTFKCLEKAPGDFNTQLDFAIELLQGQPTLLIVDNLETIQDQELVFSFIEELPSTVKVVLTSRIRLGFGSTIPLDGLSPEEGLELIQYKALEKEVQLSAAQCQSIYEKTGGHPLGITYTIGQIAVYGTSPSLATTHLKKSSETFSRYCFEDSVGRFRGQIAHKLLLALTLFPQSAAPEAIFDIAAPQVAPEIRQEALGKLYELSLLRKEGARYTMHSLTCEYISAELRVDSQLRNSWVKWYLKFLTPYQKLHWQEWQDYEPLQQEWLNLREVMEWCQSQNRYEDVQKLWHSLKGYTLFNGYWCDRLAWLDWLIEAAQVREDWLVVADATHHKGRTLAHINQADPQGEAFALGEQALQLCKSQDVNLQLDIVAYLIYLLSKKQQFSVAKDWLKQGYQILSQIPQTDKMYTRQEIQLLYCQAELYKSTNNYQKSQHYYQKALQKAQAINWQRMIAYIQGGIAAILLDKGDFSAAKVLFQKVLKQATIHQDKRCLAFCKHYLAILEKQQDNLSLSRNWAESAQQSFANLNMNKEAAEMAVLMRNN